MSKSTFFVFCLMALSLSNVNGLSEEEKAKFRTAVTPILEDCSKQYDVSGDEIKVAASSSPAAVKPCFLECVLKKIEILDDNGYFNLDKGLGRIKDFVSDPEERVKFEEIGKQCAAVNDKPVSGGNAGCERAKLLLTCVLDQKVEIPL